MKTNDLDLYISDIYDPWGEESISQQDIIENSFFFYQIDNIIDSIGTKDSHHNIDLFFNEFYNKLDDNSKIRFICDCYNKLETEYKLEVIRTDVLLYVILEQIEKYILPLLFFFEKNECIEMFANNFSYVDISVLRNFELFNKYIELNYNDFLNELNKNETIPLLIRKFFNYSDLSNAILILWKIINKDIIGINSLQIQKGV
jgi:hypothetical protein